MQFALLAAVLFQGAPQEETRIRLWHDFSHPEILDADEITGWSLAASKALNLAADKILLGEDPEKHGSVNRAARAILFGGPLAVVQVVASGASHEYGHFRSYSRRGHRDFEFVSDLDGSERDGNPFTAFSVLFGSYILGKDSYGASFNGIDDPYLPEWQILDMAGGFNQQQYNAETLADEIYGGRAHFLDGLVYLPNMLGTMLYLRDGGEGSDITESEEALALLGVKTGGSEIRYRSQFLKLAGNASISFLSAIADYVATGDQRVEPLAIDAGECRIFWPDFSSYLTLAGPTVKASERISFKGHSFVLSFEQSLPTNDFEAGIGWKGKIADRCFGELLWIRSSDGGNWFEGSSAVQLVPGWAVGLKYYRGDGYTFRREIAGKIPEFLAGKEWGIKMFLDMSFRF